MTQEELVAMLRELADRLEQKTLMKDSLYVSYDAYWDVIEGPPDRDWKTWVPTGKQSIRIYYFYKEKCD